MKVTYCLGCSTTVRTDFLWFVRVTLVFPATKSHSLMVESWLPVESQIRSELISSTDQTVRFVWFIIQDLFTSDNLRFCSLTSDCSHGVGVASECVHVSFRPDVPHLHTNRKSHIGFINNPTSSLVTSVSHLTAV